MTAERFNNHRPLKISFTGSSKKGTVLVAILKTISDRNILLKNKWYRIPAEHYPIRKFGYLAFYQPAAFGRDGKRIGYYAKVSNTEKFRRIDLFPEETDHPKAGWEYIKVHVSGVFKLRREIINTTPRRVSFGFTSLARLRRARNILQLFGVSETEQIVARELSIAGIKAIPQYWVTGGKRRYRLDFAILDNGKKVAIECDNYAAHRGRKQLEKDRIKDEFLRAAGWRVARLTESEIIRGKNWLAKFKKWPDIARSV